MSRRAAGHFCASRVGVGYTHQKSKDSCKSERHPAKQGTVSDGWRHEARRGRIRKAARSRAGYGNSGTTHDRRGESPDSGARADSPWLLSGVLFVALLQDVGASPKADPTSRHAYATALAEAHDSRVLGSFARNKRESREGSRRENLKKTKRGKSLYVPKSKHT